MLSDCPFPSNFAVPFYGIIVKESEIKYKPQYASPAACSFLRVTIQTAKKRVPRIKILFGTLHLSSAVTAYFFVM